MKTIIKITLLLFSVSTFAQDIHFSQLSNSPLLQNPANAGSFKGDNRVYLNNKTQWSSLASMYKTFALTYDMKFFEKRSGFMGFGVVVFRDKAGDVNLGKAGGQLQFSYHIPLNKNHFFTAGMQVGGVQNSLTYANAQWDNQYDGTGYNGALSSGETVVKESFMLGNIGAGLLWDFSMGSSTMSSNDGTRMRAGISISHINKPKTSYLGLSEDALYPIIKVHYNAHIGINGSGVAIRPDILYRMQGPSSELVLGTMFRIQTKQSSKYTGFAKETAMSFGLYYRGKDAIIPAFMIEYASFSLGLSYDVNMSSLSTSTSGNGGFEIALKFVNPNPFGSKGSSASFY